MSSREKDQQVYGDSTFKTGIDFGSTTFPRLTNSAPGTASSRVNPANFEDELLKLPNVVNYVALRETFLSEAPFIKRANRPFWKKWIDSKQYLNVFAASLRLVSDCITDNGVIHADKLFTIPSEKRNFNQSLTGTFEGDLEGGNSKFLSRATMIRGPMQANTVSSFQNWLNTIDIQAVLTEKIAVNISEMLMMDRNKRSFTSQHDILFYRLPEILSYMTLQSLLSTIPKLARVFNSIKFRELLLDWYTELISGIKITDCHKDREWLFKNTNDNPIILLNEPVNLSKSHRRIQTELRKKQKKTMRLESLENTKGATATSFDTFDNSVPPSAMGSPSGRKSVGFSVPSSPTGRQQSNGNTNNINNNNNNNTNNGGNNDDDTDLESIAAAAANTQLPSLLNARYGAARSNIVLQNSPLVTMYMNIGARETAQSFAALPNATNKDTPCIGYVCQNPLKLTMSHLPNRPIISMQTDVVHLEGKFREKKMNHSYLSKTIRQSLRVRNEILDSREMAYKQMKHDVHRMNKAYKIQLALLDKKPVTQKELLMAATALESIGKLTGNSVTGGGNGSLTQGAGTNVNGGGDLVSGNNSVVSEKS